MRTAKEFEAITPKEVTQEEYDRFVMLMEEHIAFKTYEYLFDLTSEILKYNPGYDKDMVEELYASCKDWKYGDAPNILKQPPECTTRAFYGTLKPFPEWLVKELDK